MTVPGWAEELNADIPADLVVEVVTLAVSGVAVTQQRTVLDEDPGDAGHVAAALRRRLGGAAASPADTEHAARALLAAGARVEVVGHAGYPRRLADAWPELGAPLWLFGRGGRLPDAPTVAIVGTRRPTLDGIETARHLARLTARAGGVVVSGMARGIDQAAHAGALEGDGPTAAVLGAGFGVDYPRRDGRVRDAIAASAGLYTELLPGSPPRKHQFLERNRIVSGMADVTVVVEGRARSGALHTARLAAAQGRDVLAVPGSLHAPTSRAPLDLIRDGATPVTRPEDLLVALGLNEAAIAGSVVRQPHLPMLSPTATVIRPLLGPVPATASALAKASGHPLPAVMAALVELAAAGVAHRSPRGFVVAPAR